MMIRSWFPYGLLPITLVGLLAFAPYSLAQTLKDEVAALRAQIVTLQQEIAQTRAQNAQLRTRLDSESQDRRRLQGDFEEVDFRLQKLQGRFDRLIGDLDVRLGEIEGNLTKATKTPTDSTSESTPTDQPSTTEQDTSTGPSTATDTQTLGVLVQDADGNVVNATQNAQPTFADRYDAAIALIRQANYVGARAQLKILAEENDQHALSSNVLYWLGETYFVESQYRAAMSNFAKSALNYPQGAKYYDSLLKVGISLGNLERRDQACATLQDIGKKTDRTVPAGILAAQQEALQRFACAE